MHTDGEGVPLGIVVAGANTHDKWLVKPTLRNLIVKRPKPTPRKKQNFCGDKGYDYKDVRAMIKAKGYIDHILSRGEEKKKLVKKPGWRARRWVVERTHGWLNRFRRILVRWEKKTENYEAMLHFASAIIAFRLAGVLG